MHRFDSSFVLVLLAISIILTLFLSFLSTRLYVVVESESQNDLLTLRQTTNGLVEGIILTTSLGQKYYAFRGIPFAELPIAGLDPYTGEYVDRRFKV